MCAAQFKLIKFAVPVVVWLIVNVLVSNLDQHMFSTSDPSQYIVLGWVTTCG